jgi:hypothetical protein
MSPCSIDPLTISPVNFVVVICRQRARTNPAANYEQNSFFS